MSELYKLPQDIEIASPEYLPNHTGHEFSPLSIDRIQYALVRDNVDLETPQGINYFTELSKNLYSPTDPDHGWKHISTVIQNSLFLAERYQIGDQKVYALLAAACLHDVIRYGVNDPARCSAEIAQHILSNHMRPLTADWAVAAIDQHSSPRSKRYSDDDVSILIYEADKLHTDPKRWVNCGLNPFQFEHTEIEQAYRMSLEEIHGTVATFPTYYLIERRMAEREALKNARAHML